MTIYEAVEQLTQTLQRAGHPVIGVSIGSLEDRRTWRVDYESAVDAGTRQTVEAVVGGFDTSGKSPTPVTVETLIHWQAKERGITFDAAVAAIRESKADVEK